MRLGQVVWLTQATLILLLSPALAAASATLISPGAALQGMGVDVRPGDRIEAWQDGSGHVSPIDDAISLWQLELSRAPYGPVDVRIRRNGEAMLVRLPGGRWDWKTDSDVGTAAVDSTMGRQVEAWRSLNAAEEMVADRRWADVATRCNEALQIDADAAGALLERCWQWYENNPDRQAGVRLAEQLVTLRKSARAASILQARAEWALARSAFTARNYDLAKSAATRALALAGGEGEFNTVTAGALQVLGFVDYRRGAPESSMARYRQAETMLQRVAPDGLQHAGVLGGIATVHGALGDLDKAVELAEKAIDRMRTLAPEQMSLGRMQFNAGLMAFERGRLADAERHLGDAMRTFALASPNGPEAAMSRAQLAQTFERRGESVRAEALLRSAVAAGTAVDPNAYETLSMRLQLAITLSGERQFAEAEAETSAIEAATRGERNDTLHADALALRAELLLQRDAPALALTDADNAITLLRPRERLIQLAPVLIVRGESLRLLHRFDEAEATLEEAARLRARLAPRTVLEADALRAQARLLRDQGNAVKAAEKFAAAIEAMEAQHDLLGGNEETRARWAARSAPFYREALQHELERGDLDAAWLLLDRYRAREFLATIGRRRSALIEHMPQTLRDEARLIAEDYLRAQKTAQSGGEMGREIFDRLQQRNLELDQRLAAADPRFQRLGSPRAPIAIDVAAQLPVDAALVSFAVLPNGTWAFVLRHGMQHPSVLGLEIGEKDLARQVDAIRLLLNAYDAGTESRSALEERSRAMYAQLISPLLPSLGNASRLLIIPDGPLHRLPFAALLKPGVQQRYLVEDYATTLLVSASAYLSLERVPGDRRALNPSVAVLAVTDASKEGAALPGAMKEAEAIRALFAPNSWVIEGAQVTADRALETLAQADIVHFASHAVVDPEDPLNSYLKMGSGTAPRLSTMDIMRAPSVRARLVTLAACDSALGLSAGGDGLLGLTRGFQFAGAQSVLATLWRVADMPTQRLVIAFYSELAAGQPLDLALAHAQRQLLHSRVTLWERWLGSSEDPGHPYYWSGFALTGSPD